jgi:hypothetical protein
MYIKLKDIYVRLCSNDKVKYIDKVKISECPYYIAMVTNDPSIYKDFVKTLPKTHQKRPTGTLDGLLKLMDDIKNDGFIYNDRSINIKSHDKYKYLCLRGRHRLCILYYLYGKHCKINIKHHTITHIKGL